MRIIKAATYLMSSVILLSVLATECARAQDELWIEGVFVKVKREHFGFGTRFIEIVLEKKYYSKENLERLWRYYCAKYPDKKVKLDIRVFVIRPGLDSKAVEALSFDADFSRQGDGAAASGGDNEFYSFRLTSISRTRRRMFNSRDDGPS